MMDMQPQGDMRPLAQREARHESTELRARGIVIFAVGLVGLGVVIHLVLEQVMEHYAKRESTVRASILPQLATPIEVPGPRLQADPAAERIKIQKEQLAQLNAYGWIDRNAGIAHIPIERAMDILASSGLPEVKEPQPGGLNSAERHDPRTSDQRRQNFQVLPGRAP